MTTLKERLAAKQRRTTTFEVEIRDATAARARLERAERALMRATLTDMDVEGAQGEYDAALVDVTECYEVFTLTALSDADLETLITLHPPLPSDPKDASWHEATFLPALLAECTQGTGMSPQDWADTLAEWSTGEKQALRLEVLRLNLERAESGIPKG